MGNTPHTNGVLAEICLLNETFVAPIRNLSEDLVAMMKYVRNVQMIGTNGRLMENQNNNIDSTP